MSQEGTRRKRMYKKSDAEGNRKAEEPVGAIVKKKHDHTYVSEHIDALRFEIRHVEGEMASLFAPTNPVERRRVRHLLSLLWDIEDKLESAQDHAFEIEDDQGDWLFPEEEKTDEQSVS
jgi:hypothetical protein